MEVPRAGRGANSSNREEIMWIWKSNIHRIRDRGAKSRRCMGLVRKKRRDLRNLVRRLTNSGIYMYFKD